MYRQCPALSEQCRVITPVAVGEAFAVAGPARGAPLAGKVLRACEPCYALQQRGGTPKQWQGIHKAPTMHKPAPAATTNADKPAACSMYADKRLGLGGPCDAMRVAPRQELPIEQAACLMGFPHWDGPWLSKQRTCEPVRGAVAPSPAAGLAPTGASGLMTGGVNRSLRPLRPRRAGVLRPSTGLAATSKGRVPLVGALRSA
jgi:hypothetical protein